GRKRHSVARRHVALGGMTGGGRFPVNSGRSVVTSEPVLSHESYKLYRNHNHLGCLAIFQQALVPFSMECITTTCQTVSYRPAHVEALVIQLE
ncbi:hypothetical protein COCCADRAFT_88130, partial [Bipolaris zeicola 26-R-13]